MELMICIINNNNINPLNNDFKVMVIINNGFKSIVFSGYSSGRVSHTHRINNLKILMAISTSYYFLSFIYLFKIFLNNLRINYIIFISF